MRYIVLVVCVLLVIEANGIETYSYQTKSITLPVDHFSFANNATYNMKYLINDTFWKTDGPIFFYTGNEGAIEGFAQNSGFIWDILPKFNALAVFAEHRYYGESLPFGNNSLSDPAHLGYLTSAQALADYVYLINDLQGQLKEKNEGKEVKVIAFGGSYGGMLAAWIRLKYPGSVFGALASSAPIFQFDGLTRCDRFNEVLTSVFKSSADQNCVANIKRSWSAIRNLTVTDDGKAWLSSTLQLCNPLNSIADVRQLTDWIIEIYANLAMVNYPYPTEFLAPLPAYPVRAFCDKFKEPNLLGKPLLQALNNALSVYTNYTKKTKCVDITTTSSTVGEKAWDYQACTELVMPMCSTDNEMFEPSPWNFTHYSLDCFKKFAMKVDRDDIAILEYGGRGALYTNIIFTNGLLDPWSGGGFLRSTTSAYAILIPNAAHHLDLRAPNKADPHEVIYARDQILNIIRSWVNL